MIQITFTEAEIEALNQERTYHPHPRVRQKMNVLWLKSQEVAHQEICRLADISSPTLCRYLKQFETGRVEGLKALTFHRPQSELEAYREEIEAYFRTHPPATIAEAMVKIEELTGLKRKPTQIRQFLKRMGMKCRKVGHIPAKADPEAQAVFKETELDPLLAQAQAGERHVFFWMPLISF